MFIVHKNLYFYTTLLIMLLIMGKATALPSKMLYPVSDNTNQYTIRIISPKSEETFQNSTQNITVTVQVTPDLAPGDMIQFYVDGLPISEPQHTTSMNLPWLPRGSHRLQAKIIQQNGSDIESEVITIFQQRRSVNFL